MLWRVEISGDVPPMLVKDTLDKVKDIIASATKKEVRTVVTGDRAFLFIEGKEGSEVIAAYRREDGKLALAGYISNLMILAELAEKVSVFIEKISPAKLPSS